MALAFDPYAVALVEQGSGSQVPVEPALVVELFSLARQFDSLRRKQHSAGHITHIWVEFGNEADRLCFRDVAALKCAEAGVTNQITSHNGDTFKSTNPDAVGKFYVTIFLDSRPGDPETPWDPTPPDVQHAELLADAYRDERGGRR